MTKFLTVLAASGALALATVAAPTTADARCRGCGIAAGVIGGIAAGAIIAGAASNRYGYYEPGYAYEPAYAPAYTYEPAYAPTYAPAYAYEPAYEYGYRYRRYGRSTSDITNMDRQGQGSR